MRTAIPMYFLAICPLAGCSFDATDQLFRGAESARDRIAAVVSYLRELQQP